MKYNPKENPIVIKCKAHQTEPIDRLTEFQGNLKRLSEKNREKLITSICEKGFIAPLFVWDDKGEWKLLDGHQRVKTLLWMREHGWNIPMLPVDVIEADNEQDAKRKLLAITSQYGEFDLTGFMEFTDGIEIDDCVRLTDGDWVIEQVEENKDTETIGDDNAPDKDEEAVSKLGEIYELGKHRLMCGDSTDSKQVDMLMGGEKADMVFTDPPYGMFLETDYSKMPSTKKEGNKKYKKIIGDNEDFSDLLISSIFDNFSYCKEIFIFGADYFAGLIPERNNGSWVVWDKRCTEKFDKMIGSGFELCWSKKKHKRMLARINNTLFSGEQDARNKVHPTQKPIKLIEWFFDYSSIERASVVVDVFGGSGSTLIASAKTGHISRLMELDPKYCDVIRRRWTAWAKENGHEVGSGGLTEPENGK